MNSIDFNFWALLAGLGFFLFGMELLETALKNMAGRTFRDFLRRNTKTPLRAILSGAFVTSVMQSSTLVSLMTLAFVGAGLLNMTNAIGVILGTNLGTTATGWFFALLGFKINIQQFAYVLLGTAAIGRLLTSDDSEMKWKRIIHRISQFFLGFALLFIGLQTMKESIEQMALHFDLSKYIDSPVILFALIGFILTSIIQSSSATMAITLSALSGGVVSLSQAAGVIIGAYLGTTLTILLGSIGAGSDKKRVAVSHFLFNLTTSVVALVLLPLIIYFITQVLSIKDHLIALVSIHTSISLLGIIIFLPFMKRFAQILEYLIPDKTEHYSRFLGGITPSIHGPALEIIKKEINEFSKRVLAYNTAVLSTSQKSVKSKTLGPYKSKYPNVVSYYSIKSHSAEIYDFCYQLLESPDIREHEILHVQQFISSIRSLVSSAKAMKNISHNIEEITRNDDKSLLEILARWENEFKSFFREIQKFLDLADQQEATEDNTFEAKIVTLKEEALTIESRWNHDFQQSFQGRSIKKSEIPTFFNIAREVQMCLNYFLSAILISHSFIHSSKTEDPLIGDHPHIE